MPLPSPSPWPRRHAAAFDHRLLGGGQPLLLSQPVAEDIAVEMHDAALPAGIGIERADAVGEAETGIAGRQLYFRQPARLRVSEEAAPSGLVLLGTLADAEDLVEPIVVDTDRVQHREVADCAGAALQRVMLSAS